MSQDSLPAQPMRLDGGQEDGRADDAEAAPRVRHAPGAAVRPTPATAAILAAAVGYAAVAGSFRRLTAPAELGTFVIGVLICWLALRRDCRRRPAPDHIDGRGTLAWGAVLVVFGIWELYADFRGSTPAHPTLSILMGPAIAPPENRAIGYLLWMAAGVWVVRR